MKVFPVAGRTVRDPHNMQLLPAEGRDVRDGDAFWTRRLRDGDVTKEAPPPPATHGGPAPAPIAAAKPERTHKES